MKTVVVIYGPTAVGKSSIAIELAKMINGEIISADSMQIYKHLNVGSAKATTEEMQGITHHLIDIKEPEEDYSVSEFCTDAKVCIEQIIKNGHIPIIVGGTGLYIKGLTEGYNFANTEKNQQFRDSLKELSNDELNAKIMHLEPSLKIDANNRRRLIRTLEKLTFGEEVKANKSEQYSFKMFAILDDRQKIYNRINARVDSMAKNGLVEEAKFLFNLNLPENNQAIKAIGYKELFPYLKGEESLEECLEVLKQKTRNYAKRQITFLNQFDNITKIDFIGVYETAKEIYTKLEDNNE